MKFAAFAIFGIGVGLALTASGQIEHAVDLPNNGNPSSTTGIGTNSKNAAGAAAATATPEEGKPDESDDTLYRGRTSESENPMLRDEGRLHFKSRPKEKIQEVDSLKNLQSGKTDPKFQGSLLHSSVTSIDDIADKTTAAQKVVDDVDERFKSKQLTFAPEKDEQPRKVQADSTPSPTPSATASPQKKDQANR